MTSDTPIFGIVGWKGSGKTTLLTSLVSALVADGYSVATIKHSHHSIAEDDVAGDCTTDSARHLAAGAQETALVTPDGTYILSAATVFLPSSTDLTTARAHLSPSNLILVEGFKHEPIPAIECQSASASAPLSLPHIVAIASDRTDHLGDLPRFARHDIAAIIEFIKAYHRLS